MAQRAIRLWRLARQGFRQAKLSRLTGFLPGAKRAGGLARRTNPRPQIKQSLGEIARPGVGSLIGQKTLRQRIKPGFGTGQRFLHRENPRGDAFHIAIQRHYGRIECNGGDGRGGIGANAGQGGKTLNRRRETAHPHHLPRRCMQVARPRIIAKPGPFSGHIFPRRVRQSGQIREARQKT